MTDIPKGYKQTEVGVIPEDWDSSKIGDYAFVTKLAGFEYTLHFDYSKSGPVIAVRVLNIKNGTLNLDYVHTIPKETSDALPRSKLKKGDLVISYVGTLGRVAVIPEDEKFHLAPNVAKLSVNREKVSPTFLGHFLNSFEGQKIIFDAAASTTQAALSMRNLRLIFFARPPLTEQKAIAEALSDADALIESLEQLIAKKRHLKQGAMQKLLTGKMRMPGFSGEWEVETFGDVFNITAGGDVDPQKTISYQDQIHCYPIYSNALTDFGLYGYCTYADHPAGSITVTARGTLGFANFRDHAYTAIGRVLVLQSKQEIDGRFFAEVINNRIKFAVESTGVPQLTAPQISAYRLPVPPFPEQEAIASILSDMDAAIAALETKLAKARLIKQGMMQELLTGRIRLGEASCRV